MNDEQDTMENRTARLMKRFSTTIENDSGGSGGGSTSGSTSSGNAGLSNLGAVPDAPLTVLGTKFKKLRKKYEDCPTCGYISLAESKICAECGSRLPKHNTKSMEERLDDYRMEQIHVARKDGQYDWIGPAIDQIMTVMKTQYPEIIHENHGLNDAIFRERITNTLCNFERWRLCHQDSQEASEESEKAYYNK